MSNSLSIRYKYYRSGSLVLWFNDDQVYFNRFDSIYISKLGGVESAKERKGILTIYYNPDVYPDHRNLLKAIQNCLSRLRHCRIYLY